MPRGSVPMRVRRRHSDAKWRASVAACYDTLKHIIPNNEKMPKRKISQALILQETERHIVNIENKLKELLSQRAKAKGKAVLYTTEDEIVEASLEDVKNDFSKQQQVLYLHNQYCSQRKRSFPSDIEHGLIEMRSSCCELAVIPSDQIDKYNTIHSSQRKSSDSQCNDGCEKSQPSIESKNQETSNNEKDDNYQLPEKIHPHTGTGQMLENKCNNQMTPRMEALLRTPDKSVRPKRPYNRRIRNIPNQLKTSELINQQMLNHVSPNKYSTMKSDMLSDRGSNKALGIPKIEMDTARRCTSQKSFKQILFESSSGFTPVKLPDDHLLSPGIHHPSVQDSPFKTSSDLKCSCLSNNVIVTPEDFDDPDGSSLFCMESIDQMDLDDSFDNDRNRQLTPSCTKSKKQQIKRDIDNRLKSRKFRTRTEGCTEKQTDDRYADNEPLYTIKREARKCRRQLEKSFPPVDNDSEELPTIAGGLDNMDNSCHDLDSHFLFCHQTSTEKPSMAEIEAASQMWQNLSTDTQDTFVTVSAYESKSSASNLSEDLLELDTEPVAIDGGQFRTSTPTPKSYSSSQVVPVSCTSAVHQSDISVFVGPSQAVPELQLLPDQPLVDFSGATPILFVKPEMIQLDENYMAEEILLTSPEYEVPNILTEFPEDKALDLSIDQHSPVENRFTSDSDVQSVSWNSQVVPQMDFVAFSQQDLF